MNRKRFQADFLRKMDGCQPFKELFDLLPDVAFFMIDRECRFVMKNHRCLGYSRANSEWDVLGKTVHDFFASDLADSYLQGNRKVMETGIPIINALTSAPGEPGSEGLIVYSQVPVRDRQGNIIGAAGIYREVEGLRAPTGGVDKLSRAVDHMRRAFAEPLSTPDLAAIAGLSRNQFERMFRRVFGASPMEYLLRMRVSAACRLLENGEDKCTAIALQCGFYDQSHFSRTFKRLMGVSPQAYRHRHRPHSSGAA